MSEENDVKVKNTIPPNEFVFELSIKKLPESWTDYKQQLKHKNKHMSLSEAQTTEAHHH